MLGILIALIAFSMSGFFTVDTIDVQGNKYYTDEEITNLAHATTGRNLIYKLNKRQMLKYLEKNPYIEEGVQETAKYDCDQCYGENSDCSVNLR